MIEKIKKSFLILGIVVMAYPALSNTNDTLLVRSNKKDVVEEKLQAMEVNGNYIVPADGLDSVEARGLILAELKKQGVKGDINSSMKLSEITASETWSNIGVQLYKVDINYAWLNGIFVIKNKKVLTMLSGVETKSFFLSDLDNDGQYEVYANAFIGSGLVSEEIQGYNIATNEFYQLSMRGKQDFHPYIENGILMTEIHPSGNLKDKSVKSGRIILKESGNKKELSFE